MRKLPALDIVTNAGLWLGAAWVNTTSSLLHGNQALRAPTEAVRFELRSHRESKCAAAFSIAPAPNIAFPRTVLRAL